MNPDRIDPKKFICIHGHFYQPPRENPWLEEVELQESAHPYHDWNERITAECYGPNTASRILDQDRRIINIVNNYAKMSFNFGPTLLSWLERHAPEVYQSILEADRKSQEQFSGHGSAMAQIYNHMIMPLANTRDKRTQIMWGLYDFEHRFKRKPEGMWLSETAVDLETLDLLAELNIRFTILAPHQARRVRKIGDHNWYDLKNETIDPQRIYLCRLPSGRSINLFFYDGPISREIAFADLLKDGTQFARRLVGVFPQNFQEPCLVHIATDGETYGHHHRYGDMALSYCLYDLEFNHLAKITNYGEYLSQTQATHEVEIVENSSWSCSHGVERWRANCGCRLKADAGWQQEWRKPLRESLDWLRDTVNPLYELRMKDFLEDPWELRDHYIDVILNRSRENVERFFKTHFTSRLELGEKIEILKWLELERHAMLMYTSCGWFFDEITGIETSQILQYAARVIQLAGEVSDVDIDLEAEFIKRLEKAPSNIPRFKNGGFFYEKYIKPSSVDLLRVGAHYAISSLFGEHSEEVKIYCYSLHSQIHDVKEAGKHKLVIGRALIRSEITWDEVTINFAALHLGDHNLNSGVRFDIGEEAFSAMDQEIQSAFLKGDVHGILGLMNHHFGVHNYSLWHLFRHERQKILDQMLTSALEDVEKNSRQIYEDYFSFIQASRDMGIILPKALSSTVEFVLNRDLVALLESDPIDFKRLQRIVDQITQWGFQRDRQMMSLITSQRINQLMEKLLASPENLELLQSIETLMNIVETLSLDLNLWRAQNVYFRVCQKYYQDKEGRKEKQDEKYKEWLGLMQNLGRFLDVKI